MLQVPGPCSRIRCSKRRRIGCKKADLRVRFTLVADAFEPGPHVTVPTQPQSTVRQKINPPGPKRVGELADCEYNCSACCPQASKGFPAADPMDTPHGCNVDLIHAYDRPMRLAAVLIEQRFFRSSTKAHEQSRDSIASAWLGSLQPQFHDQVEETNSEQGGPDEEYSVRPLHDAAAIGDHADHARPADQRRSLAAATNPQEPTVASNRISPDARRSSRSRLALRRCATVSRPSRVVGLGSPLRPCAPVST